MKKQQKLLVGITTAALIAVGALAAPAIASAATPKVTGSAQTLYIVNSITGASIPEGTVLNFGQSVAASPESSDTTGSKNFTKPAGTFTVATFIAPRGEERNPAKWNASSNQGSPQDTALTAIGLGTLVTGNPSQTPGSARGVANAGGDYALGIAYLDTNNKVLDASYTYVSVTGNSDYAKATWTWYGTTPDPTPSTPAPGTSFQSNISATTTAAVDGPLGLIAPANLNVTLGAPTLTGGSYGLSKSTGSLGEFQVTDNRVFTHKGWTLTATVSDFASGSNTISKAQFGVKPKLVSGANSGVTVGSEQVAGSAVYPATFAQADGAALVGTSKFDADLTFIAPATAAAGVYTSTLTITVVSK